MECRCDDQAELHGDEARAYADGHLVRFEVRAEGREVVHRCPTTGATWLEDTPGDGEHGGGATRLRRQGGD